MVNIPPQHITRMTGYGLWMMCHLVLDEQQDGA